MFKSYSSKSSALKGAKRAGLEPSAVYEKDGQYGFDQSDESAAPKTVVNGDNSPEDRDTVPLTLATYVGQPEPEVIMGDAASQRKVEKNRPTQNGITRPSAGGKCRMVWDECDRMVAEGGVPTPEKLTAWADANGQNPSNAQIELYQWRKYHGITGRVKVAAVQEPAQPTT